MGRYAVAAALLCMATWCQAASTESVFIEDMTWPEVRDAIAAGKNTALFMTGSTEQNGPHLALGKHNFIARHLADAIAHQLGNALVYPILPFAPTGDPSVPSGHMRFPGSVSIGQEVYAAVARDVVLSAIAAGFRTVVLMADHGDGQEALRTLAEKIDAVTSPLGVRIFYIGEVYFHETADHAGKLDTSTLMAVDSGQRWVRPDRLDAANPASGAAGDPRGASRAEGDRSLQDRVRVAVARIQALSSR